MRMNAAALLLEAGNEQGIALACGPKQMTYGELRDVTARAAFAWRRFGLDCGERVAIKLPDSCAWVSSFLGTIWAGGVAVAVNPRIPAEDFGAILNERPFRFILAESREDMPTAFRDSTVTLAEWLRALEDAAPMLPEQADQDAPAFWLHSSGTSGRPKAVVHAHRFALQVERVAREVLGISAEDRLYASSKMFFAYALGNSLFSGLKLGATVVLDPQWPTTTSVAAIVAARRPTVFFSVPSLYRNLLREGLAPRFSELGVKVCVSAGEGLPTSLREEWLKKTGITIVNGYGASETLSLVLVNRDAGVDLVPAPGAEIESLLDDANAAPARIRIMSSTLASGYWHRPEAEAENFRNGEFCPADLFEHIEEGKWRFSGREDSLVKISGRWVDLSELEERFVMSCIDISEAAAAAVPDDDGVAAIAFFYVLKTDARSDADGAVRMYAETLPHYQRPRWLNSTEALPRTATGKLFRRGLREMQVSLGPDASRPG